MRKSIGKALVILIILFAFLVTGCRSSILCPAFGNNKEQSFDMKSGPKVKYDKYGRIKK